MFLLLLTWLVMYLRSCGCSSLTGLIFSCAITDSSNTNTTSSSTVWSIPLPSCSFTLSTVIISSVVLVTGGDSGMNVEPLTSVFNFSSWREEGRENCWSEQEVRRGGRTGQNWAWHPLSLISQYHSNLLTLMSWDRCGCACACGCKYGYGYCIYN